MSACTLALVLASARAEEPDHAIHEELRRVLRESEAAIEARDLDRLLPLLTEDVEATSMTQAPVRGRDGVTAYFDEWFGEGGYMASMSVDYEADTLTDLSEDKSWGLVRGSGQEHYVAKDGDTFDFATRWTAVLVRDTDGVWRIRAVHFGTNHLDNPVLTKVSRTLMTYGGAAAAAAGVLGLGIGWLLGRRSRA